MVPNREKHHIAHAENVSNTKQIVKQLPIHISNLDANNCDKVIEKTLCILRTKGIINETCKILVVNHTNTLTSEETPVLSSNNNTLSDPNLVLFQES